MIELSPHEFHTVSSLFKGIEHSVALVYSVIEGNSPGRVFVDRLDTPSSVYLFHEEAFHYVGGSAADSSFNQAMVSLIFDDVLSRLEEQELVLFAFSDAWRQELDVLLSHRGVMRIRRKVLSFNLLRFQAHAGWRGQLTEGVCVRHIDEQLVEKNADYRPLVEARTKGFGVCVMRDDEIASVCRAVAVGGGEVEIDIHTEEKYRRQGYALLAACAFIEESLSRNLTPSWACWPEREASYALAKKLGFEDKPDVPVHFWAKGM